MVEIPPRALEQVGVGHGLVDVRDCLGGCTSAMGLVSGVNTTRLGEIVVVEAESGRGLSAHA